MTAGTMVGRYELLKCLARGVTTDLWLARTRGIAGFERHVVIKRIHEQQAQDPTFVQAFMTEARLAAALHHNNIIQVQDIGEEGGVPYFAMEYIHGADVRTLLAALTKKKLRLPLEHVLQIVSTTAQALHHAHQATSPDGKPLAIVHRDVTPANILVSFDGSVKVGDFGIAKAAITLTTQVGVLKGRSPYMAPEQCLGQPVDRRSDVFALGIVLWEMATMHRLYKGKTDHEVMQKILTTSPAKPTSVEPDIANELELVILKALAKDPINRYQSAAELATALETFGRSTGRTTPTSALGAYVAKHLGARPEPWLVVSDRVEKRASVDFDSDEPSGDELEADTQRDIPAAPPAAKSLPTPNVGKPIVAAVKPIPSITATPAVAAAAPIVAEPAKPEPEPEPEDSIVVAKELAPLAEHSEPSAATTNLAMPPPPPKQAKRKSEPTQIVQPLDTEPVAKQRSRKLLLVGASGSIVAILVAIVAAKLVSTSSSAAATHEPAPASADPDRAPVAAGPTTPTTTQPESPTPSVEASKPIETPAEPSAPQPAPAAAANNGYASHPGTSLPAPPRTAGFGDFATGTAPKQPDPVPAPAVEPPQQVAVEPPKPVEPQHVAVEPPKPVEPQHVAVEPPKPVEHVVVDPPKSIAPKPVETPKPVTPKPEPPKHVAAETPKPAAAETPKPKPKQIAKKPPATAKKPATTPKPKYDPDSLFLKVPK